MSTVRRIISLRSLTLLAALLPGAGALRADVIVRANGERLTDVRIASATWEAVEYGAGKGSARLPAESIESIARSSALLDGVRTALDRGEPARALEAIAALDASGAADWEKAELAYLEGRAHQLAGDPKAAMEAYREHLDAHRQTKDWWVPHALHGLGRSALAVGEPELADARFKELEGFGGIWKLRAQIGVGEAFARRGEALDARTAFNKVIQDRRAPLFLRHEALVRRAEVLVADRQFGIARQELEAGFFSPTASTEVAYTRHRGRATLLMASAYEAEGGDANLSKAELWLLRAAALYADFEDQQREASTRLAALYEKLGSAERAAEWRARAAGPKEPETAAGAGKEEKR